eukprot:358545-Chlamydomonas_euryale.AAC.1
MRACTAAGDALNLALFQPSAALSIPCRYTTPLTQPSLHPTNHNQPQPSLQLTPHHTTPHHTTTHQACPTPHHYRSTRHALLHAPDTHPCTHPTCTLARILARTGHAPKRTHTHLNAPTRA